MAFPASIPLVLAVAVAFAAPAKAQSLLALYESASTHDAIFQAARAQYEANRSRAAQAVAGLLPQVGIQAGVGRTDADISNPAAERSYDSRQASIQAVQPLYRPANLATYVQGERQAQQAAVILEAARQDLILRVSQAYFDVLAAQDVLAVVRAQKAAVSEQLATARRGFEVGTGTVTDIREAQARFDLVVAQEIAAENDLRIRSLTLDTLVGYRGTQPKPVSLPLVLPQLQPADIDTWVTQAEQVSPAIRQARLALEIARLETDKARAGHKPVVDFTATRGYSRNPATTTVVLADSRTTSTQYAINLNVPLFAGFSTQNRVRETLALEDRAQAELDNAHRTAGQAVRTAYLALISGGGQVRALEAAETSSQSALDANRVGFGAGIRINIDVLNAQGQLFQARRDLALARYSVLLGQLRLRQAAGTLTPDDLLALNNLLAQ